MSAYGAAAAVGTDATEADNAMVWRPGQAGHYEVWYLTMNHRASRTGYWIRYTLEAPTHGDAYAQLWFAFFSKDDPTKNFAINRRVPIASLVAQAAPFQVTIGDAVLRHDAMKGALSGDGHRVSWDLTWLPAARTHRHLPDLIYSTSFADTRVLSPNLDVPVRGTIEVDGATYTMDGEPGGQTHVWGRKHAHEWAWGHCNAFEGRRGAALETLTARLKRRGVVLPALTVLTLYIDGERLGFTDFTDTLLGRGRFGTGTYTFAAQGAFARVEGEFTCRPEDMILTEYADPDGEAAWCANTETADLRVRVWRRAFLGRWREDHVLHAAGTGHFEVAKRSPDPAIITRHVVV